MPLLTFFSSSNERFATLTKSQKLERSPRVGHVLGGRVGLPETHIFFCLPMRGGTLSDKMIENMASDNVIMADA